MATITIPPNQFFQQLSAPKFNTQFLVEPFGAAGASEFEVQYRINLIQPPGWFQSPYAVTEPMRLTSAKALSGLVSKSASQIVKDKTLNTSAIIKHLTAIAAEEAQAVSPANVKEIETLFTKAITSLKAARTEAEKQFIEGQGLDLKDRVTHKDFYSKLSQTGFISKFNSRFTIRKGESGLFHVWLSKKPWFYQKFFGTAVSADSKIATAENLAGMIEKDKDLIRANRFNTQGMVTNLTKIKGNLVRNTSPEQKARIEKAFNSAIDSLKKNGMLIAKDKNKDILPRVVGFIFEWTVKKPIGVGVDYAVKPLWNHVVKPAGQQLVAIGKALPGYSVQGLKASMNYLTPATKSVAKPAAKKPFAPVAPKAVNVK